VRVIVFDRVPSSI